MDAQPDSVATQRSPILPIAIVVVVLGAVSAAVVFFVAAGSSGNQFDPVKVAELAPADTHFFMALNTDFASAPWNSTSNLLDVLGIEQQLRDDLTESAADEDLDFEDQIVPALGTIRRAGFAAQYSSDGGTWVVFIDSRDPQQVRDILLNSVELDSESRDDDLAIDFEIYVDTSAPAGTPSVLGTHEGVMYLADSTDAISDLVRRRGAGTLGSDERFTSAIEEVTADALLVGYGNGNVLDHRDFRDIIDAFADSAEVDPREGTLAFAITARENGFGALATIDLPSGFGVLEETVSEPVDLAAITSLTPDDAIFLFAGSGLGEGLATSYETLENDPLVTDSIAPFEDMTGVSLKDDLIPLFGSSFALAIGGEQAPSGIDDLDSLWALGLIESGDPIRLAERLDLVVNELEFFLCDCNSGVGISDRGNYVRIQWPDQPLSDATLAESPTFISTLELLPPDPATLFFLNISALPEEELRNASADFGADPDGYDLNLSALLGFAVGAYSDNTSIGINFVLPIAATGGE